MLKIIPYKKNYKSQYCDFYINIWKEEPYGEFFTRENVENHLVVNLDYLFLLIHNEKLIGYTGGRPLTNNCEFFDNKAVPPVELNAGFYIDELGVDSKYRNLGWAKVLISYLISAARQDGFSEFVLRTNSSENNPARILYKNVGMETRTTADGKIHQVLTQQKRIDDRNPIDSRIYFYKKYKK